jgi:hypothetical protein
LARGFAPTSDERDMERERARRSEEIRGRGEAEWKLRPKTIRSGYSKTIL